MDRFSSPSGILFYITLSLFAASFVLHLLLCGVYVFSSGDFTASLSFFQNQQTLSRKDVSDMLRCVVMHKA